MRKYIHVISLGLFLCGSSLQAQTVYDAEKFISGDLAGTARYVGMGGAMGALGGDISTINSNPAGIGLFRSNDAMSTIGFFSLDTKSAYGRGVRSTSTVKLTFDNIGFVYSSRVNDDSRIKFVNLGFSYHKRKNFNKEMLVSGSLGVSQTDQIAALNSNRPITNSTPYGVVQPDDLNAKDAFYNGTVPWLGALAYEGFLINPVRKDASTDQYVGYQNGMNPIIDSKYQSRTSGGIDEFNFNFSVNLDDAVYLGLTIGAYSVDYAYESRYSENFTSNGNDTGDYSMKTVLTTEGTGFDVKLGGIFRPMPDEPLRVGIAIHTPTFYNLSDRNYAELTYKTVDVATGNTVEGKTYTQDRIGDAMDGYTDYKLVTPWKFNLSAGYTIGKQIALGAEYEYADYSSAKLKYDSNGYTEDMTFENEMISSMLKGVHTFKLGVEAKPNAEFSIRAGYNVSTAAMDKNAYKELPTNSIRTDTQYSNQHAVHNITFGLGYRTDRFYGDAAYKYTTSSSDFYAFDNVDLNSSKITNKRHELFLTVGMKF
ncbi:MAG: hypothetical protein WCQ82_01475 [Bacteroidaceae bacterium]